MVKCVDSSEVMRLLAGDLPVECTEVLNFHFEQCDKCAELRDEIVAMTERMQHDPGEFDDPTVIDEVMTLVFARRSEREDAVCSSRTWWRSWRSWLLVPATAAATAVLMVTFWLPDGGSADDGLQARGGQTRDLDRWVSLEVFRSTGRGYQRVRDVVATDDALAFAYLNRSEGELSYLMVFGVDDRDEVFWYYPSRTSIDDNPSSISITGGARQIELPEQVAHDLRPGPLRIFGVFSPEPLSVGTVEGQLQRDLRGGQTIERITRVGLDGVGQCSVLLQVRASTAEEPAR